MISKNDVTYVVIGFNGSTIAINEFGLQDVTVFKKKIEAEEFAKQNAQYRSYSMYLLVPRCSFIEKVTVEEEDDTLSDESLKLHLKL